MKVGVPRGTSWCPAVLVHVETWHWHCPWVPGHPPLSVFWAPEQVQDSIRGPPPFMFLWTLSVAYLQVRLGLKSAQAGSKQWVLEVWGHSCISMDWSLPLLCLCRYLHCRRQLARSPAASLKRCSSLPKLLPRLAMGWGGGQVPALLLGSAWAPAAASCCCGPGVEAVALAGLAWPQLSP